LETQRKIVSLVHPLSIHPAIHPSIVVMVLDVGSLWPQKLETNAKQPNPTDMSKEGQDTKPPRSCKEV
jgi:hypothetical protein